MQQTLPSPFQQTQKQGVNPFARALAEARGSSGETFPQNQDNPFANPNPGLDQSNPFMDGNKQGVDWAEQQRLQAEKLRRERLRMNLHRQINPVETTDIFNAREQQVKRKLDEIRHELKLLMVEVAEFNKDAELSVMANIPSPGQSGVYYFNFFEKLKAFIVLLRQKIHSARTWANQVGKKKQRKNAMGLEISGKSYEQTATVFDKMHHERSMVYGGS